MPALAVLLVTGAWACRSGPDLPGEIDLGTGPDLGLDLGIAGRPSGATACGAAFLAHESEECDSVLCGAALVCATPISCTIDCVNRCSPTPCGSDADCQSAFGELCDAVEWRCQPYIDTQGCTVVEAGAPRCGDGQCTGDETCSSCRQDCGFCPGSVPVGEPCHSNSDCAGGNCFMGTFCSAGCSNSYDCDDDFISGASDVATVCVEAVPGSNQFVCTPGCLSTPDVCSAYPGTQCTALTDTFATQTQGCGF
jgi:hypothetical protein